MKLSNQLARASRLLIKLVSQSVSVAHSLKGVGSSPALAVLTPDVVHPPNNTSGLKYSGLPLANKITTCLVNDWRLTGVCLLRKSDQMQWRTLR
jgi:hypothetical protein